MQMNETMVISSKDDTNISVFDIRNGSLLATFQNNQNDSCGFATLGNDYFITSQFNKSILNLYSWKKDQPLFKTPIQEKGGPICATSDGCYCVMGAASGNVYIWEVSTGHLLRIWEAHYNKISAVTFTRDDSYLITAGDDGVINVWSTEQIISRDVSLLRCKHSFTDHSLGVTAIYSGFGGCNSRLFSVSLDRTCKVWDLVSGRVIASILFPTFLTSVIVDPTETTLYVGGGDGVIYQTDLITLNNANGSNNSTSFTNSTELEINQKKKTFVGHSKAISSLNISMDGTMLISGSQDGTCNIWDSFSRQVIRSIANHIKGSVTCINIQFNPIDSLNFNVTGLENKKSFEPIQPFEKYTSSTNNSNNSRVLVPFKLKSIDSQEKEIFNFSNLNTLNINNNNNTSKATMMVNNSSNANFEKMKNLNQQIKEVSNENELLKKEIQKLKQNSNQIQQLFQSKDKKDNNKSKKTPPPSNLEKKENIKKPKTK